MSSSFENMCRTCMLNESKQEIINTTKVEMESIFTILEDFKEKLCLLDLLKTSAPQLKIEENDLLPKIICLDCSVKIKKIYKFQQSCLNVEREFYKMLKQNDSKDPFEDNDVTDIFKTEFCDNLEEDSLPFGVDTIVNDDIKTESSRKEEFLENCSDLSLDKKSDSDWEEKQIQSESKRKKTTKTRKLKQIDDKPLNDDEIKPKVVKRSARRKKNDVKQIHPCDKCNRTLSSEISLKRHLELHNKDQLYSRKPIGERPYLCSDCGKGFATASCLKHHSFRHLEKNLFQCPECPRSFATKNNRMNHVNNIHKAMPKKSICDICGKGFKAPYILKQHKRYHDDIKPFACEFCEKRFVTKDKQQRHTRTHTGEKPYKCQFCENAYCQSNDLTKHLRCHLGENVYQCELCPQRFPTVKIVREHFSTHKNDDEETRDRNLAELNAVELKGIHFR